LVTDTDSDDEDTEGNNENESRAGYTLIKFEDLRLLKNSKLRPIAREKGKEKYFLILLPFGKNPPKDQKLLEESTTN